MPIALMFIGLTLIITGIQDTYVQMGRQLRADLTGGFSMFMLAILMLGALGSIPAFEKLAKTFMVLVIIAIVLANKGFFTNLQQAIKQGPVSPQKVQSSGSGSGIGDAAASAGKGFSDLTVNGLLKQFGMSGSSDTGSSSGTDTSSGSDSTNSFLSMGKTFMQFFGY